MHKKYLYPAILIGLLIAFSFCYLAWGTDQCAFVFQMEYTLVAEKSGQNFAHPIILMGLAGQLLLIYGAIKPNANRWFALSAIILLSTLVALFFLVGCLSLQVPIILSTLPFIVLVILYAKFRKRPAQAG